MTIHIYHPNKSNKGFACSFWYSSKNNSVFATLLKQSSWDETNQNGIFKDSLNDPNKHVNVKLSELEVCSILECIDRGIDFKTYHDGDQKPKSISFVKWMTPVAQDLDDNEKKAPKQQGFSFSISVSDKQDSSYKNSFYIGLTFAEARLIKEFLQYTLNSSFAENSIFNTNKVNKA